MILVRALSNCAPGGNRETVSTLGFAFRTSLGFLRSHPQKSEPATTPARKMSSQGEWLIERRGKRARAGGRSTGRIAAALPFSHPRRSEDHHALSEVRPRRSCNYCGPEDC